MKKVHPPQPPKVVILKPGDLIFRGGVGFPVDHYGVFLGASWDNPHQHYVYDCQKGIGDRVATLEGFAAGKQVKVWVAPGSDREAIIQRAFHKIRSPQKYDLFVNNCEQSARQVVEGKPRCTQFEGLLTLLVIAGVVYGIVKAVESSAIST